MQVSFTSSSLPSQPAVATSEHERDAQDPLRAVGRDDVRGGDGRAQVLPPDGAGAGNEVGAGICVFGSASTIGCEVEVLY